MSQVSSYESADMTDALSVPDADWTRLKYSCQARQGD